MQIEIVRRHSLAEGVTELSAPPVEVEMASTLILNYYLHSFSGTNFVSEAYMSDNLDDWLSIGTTVQMTAAGQTIQRKLDFGRHGSLGSSSQRLSRRRPPSRHGSATVSRFL